MEMNYEEETLHRIEHEFHVQIYPRTEIMTDVGSLHFVKALGKTHRVLIPQSTTDPHDPIFGPLLASSTAPTLEALTGGGRGSKYWIT